MLGCVNEINSGGRPSLDDLVVEFVAKLLCMLNKNMNTAQLHIKLYCFRNGYVTSIQHKTVFKKNTYLFDTYLLLLHVHAYKEHVIKKNPKADLHHERNKIKFEQRCLYAKLKSFNDVAKIVQRVKSTTFILLAPFYFFYCLEFFFCEKCPKASLQN